METKDNEYFRSAVTDEWNTLRPLTEQEQTEGKKQKSVRARQHKTARRAFSLAAPVAVVAVTVTLVTTLSSLSCPVCGKTNVSPVGRPIGAPPADLRRGERGSLLPGGDLHLNFIRIEIQFLYCDRGCAARVVIALVSGVVVVIA